jgi:hypothetical protein
VLAIGLPAAGEDARSLGGDALGLVEMEGVGEWADCRLVRPPRSQCAAAAPRPQEQCGRSSQRRLFQRKRKRPPPWTLCSVGATAPAIAADVRA